MSVAFFFSEGCKYLPTGMSYVTCQSSIPHTVKMYLKSLLIVLSLTATMSMKNGCDTEDCKTLVDEETTQRKAEVKVTNDWFLDDDAYRTWRLNRKALVPILIGIGLKTLAMIGLTLTVLTIFGTLALISGKLSLTVSAAMFLKRFLSNDASTGGFLGLNPLQYPQPLPYAQHHQHNNGAVNRKSWNVRQKRNGGRWGT